LSARLKAEKLSILRTAVERLFHLIVSETVQLLG